MKGLILLIIALTLFIPLTVMNVILVLKKYMSWKALDGYFYQTALDIDRFGNRNFRTLLNNSLIKDSIHKFGDPRETISSVLGKNERDETLTVTGVLLVKLLNAIDKDHCKKSIKEFYYQVNKK
jgi:hypothetical protein